MILSVDFRWLFNSYILKQKNAAYPLKIIYIIRVPSFIKIGSIDYFLYAFEIGFPKFSKLFSQLDKGQFVF